MRIYLYTILLFFIPLSVVWAQQNQFDANVGVHVGIMNYYGDLNSKFIAPNDRLRNFEWDFLSYGISVERNFSPAWSGKIQYNRGQFIANDRAINWGGSRDFGNSNDARSLNAMTDIDDFGFMFTYHTDNGRLLSKNAFISPYFSFGVGITMFEVFADLNDVNGNRYYYWDDNTIRSMPKGSPDADIIEQDASFETNVTNLDTERDYNTTVLNIPVGAGLKFRLAERLGLALDYTLRYTFTDYLDDVSGNYREEYSSASQAYAANPTNTVAERRGNDNGNDWYAFFSVSMHYSFGKKHRSFDSPVIYSSSIYEPALLPPTLPVVDSVSSLPLKRLSVLRDSVSLEPKPVRIPKRSSTISEERSTVRDLRRDNNFQERRQIYLERRDTLDSLSYLVNKQRLENELYDLRRNASNPEVRLAAKEDSIRSAQEFYSASLAGNDSMTINTTSDSMEALDNQIAALDRQLQQMLDDTTDNTLPVDVDSLSEDTANISINVQEQEYNRRIDSLQIEIGNLRQQRNEDSLRKQTDTVKDTSSEAINLEKRMDAIQTEMDAMKSDTNSADTSEKTSDSLAIVQLQQRYNTLEERMKTLSENRRDVNAKDSVAGNVPNNASSENAINERINSMEREIDNLRLERDNARNNRGNVGMQSGQNERNAKIASLEREIDRLNNRRTPAVAPVVVPGGSNNNGRNASREEVERNQQMIDSLQQQITALRAQKDAQVDTVQIRTPATADANNSQIERLRQEIETLRANIIAMDEDRIVTEQKVVIPEVPKTEVFFDVGSSTLSGTDRTRIIELVSFVKKYPEAGLLLKGYTDPTGSPEKNLVLSKRRAESVKQVLVGEGIAENRIDTEFFGADNKTSKDLSYGRRVEIIIESSNE